MSKKESIFEKMFGKQPDSGYKFNSVSVHMGVRSIIVYWVAQGVGFGSTTFIFDRKIGFWIDTECMSKQFVKALIEEVVTRIKDKKLVIESTDIDPETLEEKGNIPDPDYKDASLIEPILWTFYYHGRWDNEIK